MRAVIRIARMNVCPDMNRTHECEVIWTLARRAVHQVALCQKKYARFLAASGRIYFRIALLLFCRRFQPEDLELLIAGDEDLPIGDNWDQVRVAADIRPSSGKALEQLRHRRPGHVRVERVESDLRLRS